MLLQWMDAGKYVEMPHVNPISDVGFYSTNLDPKTGFQILGEYPYHGSYQTVMPLIAKYFHNGRMLIEAYPLSTEIVEMMVPVIKASMEISIDAKIMFMKEQDEKEEDERSMAFEDAYQSSKLSSALTSTKWLDDKQRSIERAYNAAIVAMFHRNRRFTAPGRPTNV